MKPGTKILAGQLLGYAWLCVLAGAFISFAISTERRTRQVEEYPCCCDPFGYLQMAQDIRQATDLGQSPSFTIESAHSRLLIQLMQSRNVPLPLWDEMVAPLAYRYFPRTGVIGIRYPPGAGMMLALFPQDKALHRLDRLVIIVFLVAGLAALILAAVKRAWLSAGIVILCLELGLDILGNINIASFSINAMLAPLLLSAICLFAVCGFRPDSRKSFFMGWALTFVAGLLFGFAILIRLPVILLMLGVLVLLWPKNLRSWHKGRVIPFALGVFLGGVVPVSIHQSRLAGAWYLPTYTPGDTGPPRVHFLWSNLVNYFGTGRTRIESLILLIIVAGSAALFVWLRSLSGTERSEELPGANWKRLFAAAFLVWGVATVYFLTHEYVQQYYLTPSTFGASLLLALGAFAVEVKTRANGKLPDQQGRIFQFMVLTLALAPGLVAIHRAWSNYERPSIVGKAPRFVLPAELADERAWIWADELSGTIWYYARKPAHKLSATDKETRAQVYKFVLSRGEPQYIVGDDPNMKPVEDEIRQMGGRLELRGEIDGNAYYLIHWQEK